MGFLAFVSLLVGTARADTPEEGLLFERLAIEEDSGGGFIFSIRQDRRGFIWLGTNRGLKRHLLVVPKSPIEACAGVKSDSRNQRPLPPY